MNPSKNLDRVIIKVNQENGCIYGTHVCTCVCVCMCLSLSRVQLFATPQTVARSSLGENSGMGCHFLPQRIFLTQELNPGLLHCAQMLACTQAKGDSRRLKLVSQSHSTCERTTSLVVVLGNTSVLSC